MVTTTVTWACFLYCFCFSMLMMSPSAACALQSESSSHVDSPIMLLPRKLRVVAAETVSTPYPPRQNDDKEQKRDGVSTKSGNSYNEKIKGNEVHERLRTEEEGTPDDTSTEFFTMDYSHVKKRRPIHNKSFPMGP